MEPFSQDPSGEELSAGTGPQASDVHQGQIGDCFVDAPLAALAQTQPSAIDNTVTPALNAQGKQQLDDSGRPLYDVVLYYKGTPETYKVSDSFLLGGRPGTFKGNDPIHDSLNQKSILWPALIEKGLAEYTAKHPDVLPITGTGLSNAAPSSADTSTPDGLNAAYNNIASGGDSSWVLGALTGQTPTRVQGSLVTQAVDSGALNGGTTSSVASITLQGQSANGTLPSGARLTYDKTGDSYTYTSPDGTATHLPNHHAYAVIGRSGDEAVLYNPQGVGEETGGGTLHIAIADLPTLCQLTTLSPPASPASS